MNDSPITVDWQRPDWDVLDRMDLGVPIHAVCFDLAWLKRRNFYFGPIRVDEEICLFHRTLCAQFSGQSDLVFRVAGTEWLAVTHAPDFEVIVRAVAGAYVELTPMVVTYRFDACLPDGQVRVGELKGAGVIERAFRCGVIRLQAGSAVSRQIDAARKELWSLPLNLPIRLDLDGSKTRQGPFPILQIDTLPALCCPFCGAVIMEPEEAANRVNKKTFFVPAVGPLYYGDPPTPCPACPAVVQCCEEEGF